MNRDFHDYMCIVEKTISFISFIQTQMHALNNKNINPIHDEIIKLKLGLKGSSIDQ